MFMAVPRVAPMGSCGGALDVKSNCFIYFLITHGRRWSDFNQTWQDSSLGAGDSKSFIWFMWPPWGPRERAPEGQNHANFKVTSSPDPEVEQSSYQMPSYVKN